MRLSVMLLAVVWSPSLLAGSLQLYRFETQHACEPYQPPPGFEAAYRLFQASLDVLPEESVVTLSALTASGMLDYKDRDPNQLASETYASVQRAAKDPDVAGVPSTLEYSYLDKKPDHGFYYLWMPDERTPSTRLIFYLHGFGGCFRYYAYFMKRTFPDDIVVLPVYGYSGGLTEPAYMRDLVEDMRARGIPLKARPWLIGLSAGGYAMFDLYSRKPEAFAGGISLASLCAEQDLTRLSKDMSILMINGDHEQGITEAVLERQHREIRDRVGYFEPIVLDGDHFFLFEREDEVSALIRGFMEREK